MLMKDNPRIPQEVDNEILWRHLHPVDALITVTEYCRKLKEKQNKKGNHCHIEVSF